MFSFSSQKMEAAGLFEKLLTIYQTPRHHMPEEGILEGKHCLRKDRGVLGLSGTKLWQYYKSYVDILIVCSMII
jgi:hypothetical protein